MPVELQLGPANPASPAGFEAVYTHPGGPIAGRREHRDDLQRDGEDGPHHTYAEVAAIIHGYAFLRAG